MRSPAFARLTRAQDEGLRSIVSVIHYATKDEQTCAQWWPRFISRLKATREAYTCMLGALEWEEGEAALFDMANGLGCMFRCVN